MTALAKILDDRNLNAHKLKVMIGGGNAYAWADGTSPLPAHQMEKILQVLHLEGEDRIQLEAMVSIDHRAGSLTEPGRNANAFVVFFRQFRREPDEMDYYAGVRYYAERLGISPGTLGRYLEGAPMPLSVIVSIAEALVPQDPNLIIGGLVYQVAATTEKDFDRLRTDLSNADDRDDVDRILAEYDSVPADPSLMDPADALDRLGLSQKLLDTQAAEMARSLLEASE